MIDDNSIKAASAGGKERLDPQPDEPIGDVFARLVDSGRDYAQAELDRQKLRAGLFGAAARDVAIYVMVALILCFAAMVALLIGLVIALSPALTPAGATAAVVAGALAIAGILLLLARNRIRGLIGAMKP